MRQRERPVTERFITADWPAPDSIVAGTSLRTGGASAAPYDSLNLGAHVGDEVATVLENRIRLCRSIGLHNDPAWLRQVHGRNVAKAPFAAAAPEADGSWTSAANTACAVLTADCLPVLLTTRDGAAVGAAHAGWRGLAAGVIDAVIDAMGAPPERLLAWLGPAISQPAFEVGDEVREAFVADDAGTASCFEPNPRGRWQADLYGLARHKLALRGITAVYGGGRCTHQEDAAFFSYRRDGETGRMASLIYRSEV